jgi:hypothetical protein
MDTRHAARAVYPTPCSVYWGIPLWTQGTRGVPCVSLFFLILPLKVVEGVGGPDSLLFSYIEV